MDNAKAVVTYYDIKYGNEIPEDVIILFINSETKMPKKLPDGLKRFFANSLVECGELPAGLESLDIDNVSLLPNLPANLLSLSANKVAKLNQDLILPPLFSLSLDSAKNHFDFSKSWAEKLKDKLRVFSANKALSVKDLPNLQYLSVGENCKINSKLPDNLFYFVIGDYILSTRDSIESFWRRCVNIGVNDTLSFNDKELNFVINTCSLEMLAKILSQEKFIGRLSGNQIEQATDRLSDHDYIDLLNKFPSLSRYLMGDEAGNPMSPK